MELVDTAIEADEARRAAIGAFESARAEQKSLGSQVARAKGDEKAALLARTKELSGQVKAFQLQVDAAEARFSEVMKSFGNIVIDGVPAGGEDDLYVIETNGTPRDFEAEGIQVRDHLEIGEIIGGIDMERGAASWSRVGARKLRLREPRMVRPSKTSQRRPAPQMFSEPAIECFTRR